MSAERTVDVEEVGRRMRALFMALGHSCDHEATVRRYEEHREELYPADSVDVDEPGSWGWWAQRILTP